VFGSDVISRIIFASEKDGLERLYFVVETKGSILKEDLRQLEANKIACGKKHFAAINEVCLNSSLEKTLLICTSTTSTLIAATASAIDTEV